MLDDGDGDASHPDLWPFGFQIGLCPALHGHLPNRTRASRAQPLARSLWLLRWQLA